MPKILLGLGATCLLVAAVIFLAVAWSWLGIGGRTAVLLALSVSTAAAGQWLSRRSLGVAAEALTVVSLGLVVLDLVGAQSAGWVDASGPATLLGLVGATLLACSVALALASRPLFAPQVVAPLGLGLLVLAIGATSNHVGVVAVVAVLSFTGLALLGRELGSTVLPWTGAVGAVLAFTWQAGLAAAQAQDHPTLRGLWLEGHGLGLIATATLVLLPRLVAADHDDLRQLSYAASAVVLSLAAAAPALDEGLTALTLAAAAAAALWAVAAGAAPPRWYAVPRVPLAGALLALAPVAAVLTVQGVGNLLDVAPPLTADWLVRLHPVPSVAHPLLLPLAVGVVCLAAAVTLPRSRGFGFAVSGAGLVAALVTAAHYPLPLVLFVAALGPLGLAIALPSAVLTLLPLGEVALLAATLVRRATGRPAVAAAMVLPAALGAFLWLGGEVLDVPEAWRGLVVLVVVGLLALGVPRVELETTAAVTVLLGSSAGIGAASDPSVAAAVHLTLGGALVTVTSMIHRDHRPLAWFGGLLLAAATWVRLHDVGVSAPEAYTLPTATVLLLVGVHRLRRDRGASTVAVLLPGLGLAVVPTLLWALVDPLSARAVVIGAVAVVLLVAGAVLRWTAPVLVGWGTGTLLVLRELAPYAAQTPQWVVIGGAGVLLVVAGISWEREVRELRRAAAYLGRLR